MTVAELITELQKQDPSAQIVTNESRATSYDEQLTAEIGICVRKSEPFKNAIFIGSEGEPWML